MKRKSLAATFAILITVLLCFTLGTQLVSAQNQFTILNVDHQIQVLYSGNVVIQETVTLSDQTDTFLMGFPYKYANYILKAVAFDETGTLPVSLGVQLGNQSGLYGAEINLQGRLPKIFSVVFIFSNDLLTETETDFTLDFPAFPSFTQPATRINVNLLLPSVTSDVSIAKSDGNVNATSFTKDNLPAFANIPATATFSPQTGKIQLMDVLALDRVITVYPTGEIKVSDDYRILNKAATLMTVLQLDLPNTASNVVARDILDKDLQVNVATDQDSVATATLTLQNYLATDQFSTFLVEYYLPTAPPEQTTHFTFNLDLFPVANYYVSEATLLIVPPEGAHFVAPQVTSLDPSLSVVRELFQETIQIQKTGVSYIDRIVPTETSLQVVYDYNPLWLSFRPTLAVWALSIVGSILISIWRRPKAPTIKRTAVPRLSAGLGPDNIRAFTEAYEERRRITHELRVVHARAQKGKIPRNYYKSQRKNLETRVDALTRNINQLKDTFRNAGGKYADLTRQLDATENELSKARAKIRQAEERHRKGDLSTDDYKQALSDYQRQKEKLEQQINGILLRLREEIH
jgi:hypothetical protein